MKSFSKSRKFAYQEAILYIYINKRTETLTCLSAGTKTSRKRIFWDRSPSSRSHRIWILRYEEKKKNSTIQSLKKEIDPTDNQNSKLNINREVKNPNPSWFGIVQESESEARGEREREMSSLLYLCVLYLTGLSSLPTNALYWLGVTWSIFISFPCRQWHSRFGPFKNANNGSAKFLEVKITCLDK